jgi:IPT/TIG domain-containing protein
MVLLTACGGPTGPSGPAAPVVGSITPARGSIGGGTTVRITGANFGAGAIVTLGGSNATDVVVESPTVIVARTGLRIAGVVDVEVSVNGRRGVLTAGFTYDVEANAPPVVASIVARGTKPNEPAGFADVGEEIEVTANVENETPVDQLTFEWSADAGTFTGAGASVRWRAPSDAGFRVPADVRLTLTVIESYVAPDENGQPVQREYRVARSATVSVHNSTREVGVLARDFLLEFSDSRLAADVVVRTFSRSSRCAVERALELQEIEDNRTNYVITSSVIGAPSVSVQFGAAPCSHEPRPGDACAAIPAVWESTCSTAIVPCVLHAEGVDFVTAVYEQSQWRLCSSYFRTEGSLGRLFIR